MNRAILGFDNFGMNKCFIIDILEISCPEI